MGGFGRPFFWLFFLSPQHDVPRLPLITLRCIFIIKNPGVVSEWSTTLSGQIAGNNLNAGDKVIARFFDAHGEVTAMRTDMTIATAAQGDANQWSYDLAQKINAAHQDVGVKDEGGEISPVHGANSVYVKDGSTLKSVAISYEEQKAEVNEAITVSGLQSSKIEQGNATVTFHVNTHGNVDFEAHVMNHHGADSTGPHDYIFPDNIASDKTGTVVLQPKDGKTYQCKPFPYSGYCVQWSQYATQFEPGVGSAWKEAWVLKH